MSADVMAAEAVGEALNGAASAEGESTAAKETELFRGCLKRTFDLFKGNVGLRLPLDPTSQKKKLEVKLHNEYAHLREVSAVDDGGGTNTSTAIAAGKTKGPVMITDGSGAGPGGLSEPSGPSGPSKPSAMQQLIADVGGVPEDMGPTTTLAVSAFGGSADRNSEIRAVVKSQQLPKPVWHPPWKLARVTSGHTGWVRCIAVEPGNEWFCTSGNDRLIKIWDLASGTLKLSLTGHSSCVRAMEVSARHPYLFSASEDCEVKCWDLEQNMIIRNYHGHLSGVYCLKLHPTLDILATGGRDATVRIWDMRTKKEIFVLTGHTNAVCALVGQAAEPQFISGSMDKMVRLWDLAAGKCSVTLTNHKKSIRALAIHPSEYTFVSCGADNGKVWRCPAGEFQRNISGHNGVINACVIKEDSEGSILVGGSDDGYLHFWDWNSGYHYQQIEGIPQPGSLSSENGVFALAFDQSNSRLITGECDKTVKIYKEDPNATPETHPIKWVPPKRSTRGY